VERQHEGSWAATDVYAGHRGGGSTCEGSGNGFMDIELGYQGASAPFVAHTLEYSRGGSTLPDPQLR
jgi:hypothetical protein